MSDVNSLLDGELDDLQDMPSFEPYPDGSHVVTIKFEEKSINGKPSVELALVAVETQELADPATDKPLVAGAETNVLFQLDNEFGQGSLKEILKPLSTAFGLTQPRALMEAANGAACLVTTKKRWSKDKTTAYTSIKSIAII